MRRVKRKSGGIRRRELIPKWRATGDSNPDLQIGSLVLTTLAARSCRDRERGVASGQHATREQDCANEDCDQHGAHDTEPFLVGRRVGDFALKNVAHRTTPSMNRYAVSRARDFLCGKNWRQLWSARRNVEKAGWCSVGVTMTIGSPRCREGTRD